VHAVILQHTNAAQAIADITRKARRDYKHATSDDFVELQRCDTVTNATCLLETASVVAWRAARWDERGVAKLLEFQVLRSHVMLVPAIYQLG
jgi:hypothetical protein